jgi:tetratricopeptide (TPR) repeat protein
MFHLPLIVLATALASPGDAAKPPVQWEARDVTGQSVAIAAEGRPTVLVFLMAGQPRSLEVMRLVQQYAGEATGVQVAAIVSGPNSAEQAKPLRDAGWRLAIVADVNHEAAGKLGVHAWPTTLVFDRTGRELAHLAGLPPSYVRDLTAYVEHAAGRIDAAQLQQRLVGADNAADRGQNAASRYLPMIDRLMERRQHEAAEREIRKALEQHPDDPRLRLALAQWHLATAEPAKALAILDGLDDQIPAWQLQTQRGRALLAADRHAEALTTLTEALRLNPQPAEAHYLLGRLHEQAQRWQQAATHYRAAFEATPAGKSASQ